MPRKLTLVLAAIALALPVYASACGGDGGGGDGGGGNRLATEDNLKVDQDRADIEEFCNLAQARQGDLYDRALFAVVNSVDQLVIIYKDNQDKIYREPLKKRDIAMKQLVQDSAKKLQGCGPDGKRQAQKLTQALQSS